MTRKDFISDHLVDIRARLKANYEKQNRDRVEKSGEVQPSAASIPAGAADVKGDLSSLGSVPPSRPEAAAAEPPRERTAALGLPIALPQQSLDDSDFKRAYRDLEGQILRDCAESAGELELLTLRRCELEHFAEELKKLRRELAVLSGSPAKKRELEALRFQYLQASGRAAAFMRSGTPTGTDVSSGGDKRLGRLFVEALPLGLAVLAGALVVSGVLVLLFG